MNLKTNDADSWRHRLMSFGGDDPATVASICGAFLEEVPRLVRRIPILHRSGDSPALLTAIHTLKSCLRYVAPAADTQVVEAVEQKLLTDQAVAPEEIKTITVLARRWTERVNGLYHELATGSTSTGPRD